MIKAEKSLVTFEALQYKHKKLNSSIKSSNKKWTDSEDKKLLNLINSSSYPVTWNKIAANFNKTARQCYSRYKQINPNFNKGKWSTDEEDKLRRLVDKIGKKWSTIAKNLKTRSSKQIRDHYNNCMDKSVNKTMFSEEEIQKIKNLFMLYGPKWALISKHFNGRTCDAIKNKYYWSIKASHTPDEIEQLKSNKKTINLENNYYSEIIYGKRNKNIIQNKTQEIKEIQKDINKKETLEEEIITDEKIEEMFSEMEIDKNSFRNSMRAENKIGITFLYFRLKN